MNDNSSTPVLWLFGLPSAGKTTLARALRQELRKGGHKVALLDGDDLRGGLCADLGFSDVERAENIRRAAEIAKLLRTQEFLVICAFITPKQKHRDLIRSILGDQVKLIHVDCPLAVCIDRDVKGLYGKAKASLMTGMTGVQDGFETPSECDLSVDSHGLSIPATMQLISDTLITDRDQSKISTSVT